MKLTFQKNIGLTMLSMIGLLCLCKKSGVTIWLVTSMSTISLNQVFLPWISLIMNDFQLKKLCSPR
jgi:hypothetical protein